MRDRTGQVWELAESLNVPPRIGLIVGVNERKTAYYRASKHVYTDQVVSWNVVMLLGDNPGRRLTWEEEPDEPFEDHPHLRRLA